ncbi:MAG: hypothetical protein Fur0035_16040 [Anaerolineales bacterium]
MKKVLRWMPAMLVMAVIFIASSTSSEDLPTYGALDTLVKKGGHMTGYGLLALAYWLGLSGGGGIKKRHLILAWLMALLYALTDEFHQSFTPGRHPALLDVFLFDGGGAALALAVLAKMGGEKG